LAHNKQTTEVGFLHASALYAFNVHDDNRRLFRFWHISGFSAVRLRFQCAPINVRCMASETIFFTKCQTPSYGQTDKRTRLFVPLSADKRTNKQTDTRNRIWCIL